ncbi:alpha/beta hydrolase, partial [Mycobacterium sp. ITM-2017-0098]
AGVSPIPTAQCGTVAVPIDYAKPEGAQAQLAVLKVPASGSRMGVLVVNPGGPGASAVDTVASMGAALADTDILRHFDLVGIDPR